MIFKINITDFGLFVKSYYLSSKMIYGRMIPKASIGIFI